MQGAALEMDHPVAYDMVLDYIRHVREGCDSAGSQPRPVMEEDRRCHYVVVNSTKSNQEGNHWGLGLWDGRHRPNSLTLIDPYADPSAFKMQGMMLWQWACGCSSWGQDTRRAAGGVDTSAYGGP